MINFAEGWGFNEMSNLQMTKSEIKELIKDLMKKNPYSKGSFHGGLGLTQIKEIINYLMFVEKNDTIRICIDKEYDQYHLSLTIESKYKDK